MSNKGYRKDEIGTLNVVMENLVKENKKLVNTIKDQMALEKQYAELLKLNEHLKNILKGEQNGS